MEEHLQTCYLEEPRIEIDVEGVAVEMIKKGVALPFVYFSKGYREEYAIHCHYEIQARKRRNEQRGDGHNKRCNSYFGCCRWSPFVPPPAPVDPSEIEINRIEEHAFPVEKAVVVEGYKDIQRYKYRYKNSALLPYPILTYYLRSQREENKDEKQCG